MMFTLLITSLYIMAAISPGPDFFIVTKNALVFSRRAAVMTAIGVALGVAVHASYSIFALDYINAHAAHMVNIIRYIGACYLIYLGGKGMLTTFTGKTAEQASQAGDIRLFSALSNGFLCNLLNPKAVLFTVSIFTFIAGAHVSLTMRIAYGIEMTVLTLLWFVFVAIAITAPAIHDRLTRVQGVIIKLLSLLLFAMGLYLLMYPL